MTTRLATALSDLSALPRSEYPVLSVYLDWSVGSNGQRPALAMLEQELARHAATLDERGPARASFDADRERIERYLADEAPRDAAGIILFACDADGLWSAIPLTVPVNSAVAVDSYPHIYELARLLDDHETFLVAVAEGQQARIYVMSLERLEQVQQTAASEEINRVQVGGPSQLRYANHTAFVIQLHMNELAAALQSAVQEHRARHIVILTNDAMKGPVRQSLSPQLQALVVELGSYQHSDQPEQLFDALYPLMQAEEHKQEQALLERLADQLATKGGLAFGGEQAVAQALLKGQVDTLLLGAAYAGGQGGECPTCGVLRPGQRQNCPYDGSELLPVELREALVRHTLRQGGRVEVVGLEGALEEHGGVAAMLRFRDDIQRAGGDGIA